jgi:hypothetical protein
MVWSFLQYSPGFFFFIVKLPRNVAVYIQMHPYPLVFNGRRTPRFRGVAILRATQLGPYGWAVLPLIDAALGAARLSKGSSAPLTPAREASRPPAFGTFAAPPSENLAVACP